ncbi:MAG: DUF5671 domain-containing protein [Paracoccus sp. (in: a-proteobacteria)]|uniref:DUF5671 domain-containing protein n=1 Tax=Paracoccus sp. TaxID=267 RepID=UPI003919E703
MQARDELGAFLRDGLAAGHTPEALGAALRAAGWPEARIAVGLALWQQAPGLPPVPVPPAALSPRDALVHGLGFAALAMLSWHVVQIGFLLADQVTEDVGQGAGWAGSARWPVAMLVVMLPVFVLLHLRGAPPSLLRRWLAALSGFLAGLALLGSLAATVHALLSGDLTLRFALKAGVVAVTAALVFATYRAELSAARSAARSGRAGAVGLAGLGVLALLGGLWLTGGPGQGRAEQRDAARMADLEALAAQARCLALEGRAVPPIGVSERCPEVVRAADPWTGAEYLVEGIGGDRLRLCAVMESDSVWRDEVAGPGCVLVDLSDLRAGAGGNGPGLVPPDGGILAD